MRRNSRIAIYCDCNSRGGVWAYSVRLLLMLRRTGFEPHLITHPARDDREEELLDAMTQQASDSLLLPRDTGPDESIEKMSDYLVDNRIDIFIPNYRRISYSAAALTTRRHPLRIIGVCHNDHESYYSVLIRYQSIISVFICASNKTKAVLYRKLHSGFRKRIALIPHFVEVDKNIRASYKADPFTVIYHGRIQEEQKHCSQIVELAGKVCHENASVRFLLIGDGKDTTLYQDMIESRGLSDNVEIRQSLPWSQLQPLLGQCQMAVLTSSYEGFCYGAAEALSLGLPMAAFDCGEVISDFLYDGHNGRVVPWGDTTKLSQWILFLAKNPDSWAEYSNNAYEAAEASFSYDTIARSYVKALESSDTADNAWPVTRPVFIPESGRSLRSFIEKKGLQLGVWL